MGILGVNIQHDIAMARQAFGKGTGQFQKALKGAIKEVAKNGANSMLDDMIGQGSGTSGSTTGSTASSTAAGKKLASKLNEAMSVGFVAPMLADALGNFSQKYFANSPAEQAYAKQLYTEIATKMGQSSKFPIARNIAQAMLQRLNGAAQSSTQPGGTSSGTSPGTASSGTPSGTQSSGGTPSTGA